jgi:6-phosphogluconolactonase
MAGHHSLLQFDSPSRLVESVADRWLKQIRPRPACVAFSGGRIARLLFDTLAQRALANRSALDSIEFFWADERCVSPSDPESNYALAHAQLLAPLRIRPARIHRLRGELDPSSAAQSAEADLRQIAPIGSSGQPVLDLVFLGMGEDGHIASLFPNASSEVLSSTATYIAVTGPKPPPRRLTLTYAALAAAREVWVLVSGPGKESKLEASLSGTEPTPLARLLSLRENTLVFSSLDVATGPESVAIHPPVA